MKEILAVMNPWWDDEEVPRALRGIDRPSYTAPVMRHMKRKAVTIISGSRRTGKTTLMMQTIQRLIEDGIPPLRILYAQMDHAAIPRENAMELVVRTFREMHGIPRDEKIYLFLDEVQYVEDWARHVKGLHDLERVKACVSGSSAAMLRPEAMTFLVGRQRTFNVSPLTYDEFLRFKGVAPGVAETYLHKKLLHEYLTFGGYPEVVLEAEEREKCALLDGYFHDMLYKDIVRVHGVRDIETLRDVARFLVQSVGTPASLNKMSRTFKVSINTLRDYVGYIEHSYLIAGVQRYSRSINERLYSPLKYYPVDTGFRVLFGAQEGANAENAVHNALASHSKVFYWKETVEMDFYAERQRLAVECKFRDDITEKDVRGLLTFMQRYRPAEGVVVTESAEDERTFGTNKIRMVPLWRFLLAQHGSETHAP